MHPRKALISLINNWNKQRIINRRTSFGSEIGGQSSTCCFHNKNPMLVIFWVRTNPWDNNNKQYCSPVYSFLSVPFRSLSLAGKRKWDGHPLVSALSHMSHSWSRIMKYSAESGGAYAAGIIPRKHINHIIIIRKPWQLRLLAVE